MQFWFYPIGLWEVKAFFSGVRGAVESFGWPENTQKKPTTKNSHMIFTWQQWNAIPYIPLESGGNGTQHVSPIAGMSFKQDATCMHTHMHSWYTMRRARPKIVWWKNLYWCPIISALPRRGLVTQPAYNSQRTLWPHVIHSPSCSTVAQALIIKIRARGNGVEALLDGALLLIPANPKHLWTEVTQTRETFRDTKCNISNGPVQLF